MAASVVRNSAAMDAAFWSADRVTLAGSRMPAAIISTYSPVAALRPQPVVRLRTFSTTTPASRPGVDGDLPQRGLGGDADDVRTGGLVAGQVELLERLIGGLQQRDPAAGDDALLDRRLGVADRVL